MTLRALTAYAPWHFRDVVTRALVPMAFFSVFGGLPIAASFYARPKTGATPEQVAQFVQMVYVNVAPLCILLGAFLSMTQGISADREKQHVRFVFAHPVAPALFYLQRFVITVFTYALFFVPVPLALRAMGATVPLLESAVAMGTAVILIGGLTTLLAALTNRDGIVLILTWVLTQTLQQLASQGSIAEWVRPVVRGLPPAGSLNEALQSLLMAGEWPVTDLVHINGYGLGLLIAGLLVLRRAPLVR